MLLLNSNKLNNDHLKRRNVALVARLELAKATNKKIKKILVKKTGKYP